MGERAESATTNGEVLYLISCEDTIAAANDSSLFHMYGHSTAIERISPTCLGDGSLSDRYMKISRQRPTKSALIKAFDSRVKPWIIAENKSLHTNSLSSTLFVEIARRITSPQREITLDTASLSVQLNASMHIFKTGIARLLLFNTNLQKEIPKT